ncbi:uncharacterized protein LOC111639950 isoform X3 [Centruroides sculpturatus]|uniref:uncharacterized protein LOC111639950 isoform X3 n=1 Tax=Centruroides sculpturatus TaxID=218467 RepID=UPI000C6D7F29|nr:uncharacterized protein LOC111639950 isoform X3 [Centruroides sculpturatus]
MSILVLLPFLFYFSFCGENVVSGFSFYATTPAREGDLLFPASNEWQESRGRPFSIREPSRPPLRRTTKEACPPGEFSEFEESRKCFPCPPDTYAPKYASTRCIPCPPGSGTWSQSSTALRSCRGKRPRRLVGRKSAETFQPAAEDFDVLLPGTLAPPVSGGVSMVAGRAKPPRSPQKHFLSSERRLFFGEEEGPTAEPFGEEERGTGTGPLLRERPFWTTEDTWPTADRERNPRTTMGFVRRKRKKKRKFGGN